MNTLEEILGFYGMPKYNIKAAAEQIAETYGACRYLDGVKAGAEAVKEQKEIAEKETRNE